MSVLSGIGKFLFGSDGEKAKDVFSGSSGLEGLKGMGDLANDPALKRALMKYMNPDQATGVAAQQVQGNPMLSGLFGKGGIMDSRIADEKDLSSRGYSLQPEDHEAFGQASNEIARQFGQEENSLAQALASRGLASGASGAAGVAYSGLHGNKLERLAASQRQIASDRMESNRKRLADVRGSVDKVGNQAAGALNDQFSRNMGAVQQHQQALKDAMEASSQEQNNINNQFGQQQATATSGLGGAIGDGIKSGVYGGISGIGKSLGSAIGGKLGGK